MIFGASGIFSKIRNSQQDVGWANIFCIGLGILSILFGISVIIFSGFGITIASILIGVILLVNSTLIFTSMLR